MGHHTRERQLGIGGGGEVQTIRQVDALHHHGQLVKSIRAKTQHLEVQVHLGRSGDRDRAHRRG